MLMYRSSWDMSMMHNRPAAVGLLLAVAACTTVRQVQPARFIPRHTPALVWVTTKSRAVVLVAQPQIDGDTLRGSWAGTQKPLAIPLQGIHSVRAKVPARAQTVLLFATLGLVAGTVIRSLTASGTHAVVVPPCPDPDAHCP